MINHPFCVCDGGDQSQLNQRANWKQVQLSASPFVN